MIILLIFGVVKKIQLHKMSYSTEPYTRSKNKIKSDLIKSDLKNATGVDTQNVAKSTDLASLKSNVDELDIDKL